MIGLITSSVGGLASVRLDGELVWLRPPRTGDWREWADLREASRDFLTPWEPAWPADALSRAAFQRRLRQQAADWRDDRQYSFFIFRNSDDALVGGINLSNVRRGVAQMATAGYWIGEAYARRGYMRDGLRLAAEFCFDHLGLHRLEAACVPENAASKALLLNSGFQEEGFAKGYLRIAGRWRDHILFGASREDIFGR